MIYLFFVFFVSSVVKIKHGKRIHHEEHEEHEGGFQSVPCQHYTNPKTMGMDFIYRLIDFVNILALRNASGIVVLSQTMKNVIWKKVYVFLTALFPSLLPLNGICDN